MSNDGAYVDFDDEIERQKGGEWIRAGIARMAPLRAEMLRKLNEVSCREATEANADQPLERIARTDRRPTETIAARKVGDLAELVTAGTGLSIRDGPA